MSEQVIVLDEVNKEISKTSSAQSYESAWLGRWTQLGTEVKLHSPNNGTSKELIRPEDKNHRTKSSEKGIQVSPFPIFKVSQAYPITKTTPYLGSSSKGDNGGVSSKNCLDFPIQEKTTQNLLECIRPVRIYATVDSIQRPEVDGHRRSMKLKGKVFGGYLDLFPNLDHQYKGVRLESLESSKGTESRKNESSAETDTLGMDRLQMIHLSGSNSSSSNKGKGRKSNTSIRRTEIPDMNEEPPLILDIDDSEDEHRGETSNSVTHSMNVNNFLSRENKRARLEPEPELNSRWVKRLKTNISNSRRHDETKNLMKIEEPSTDQKNNNLFLEILKSGMNNLQPRNQELEIKNPNHGDEDITLGHPWIQRWCKKKKTTTSTEQQEISFEPGRQKEFEKRHYPSIAAMALMGKAMSGLNPHGLKKTESLMVWNAQDFR